MAQVPMSKNSSRSPMSRALAMSPPMIAPRMPMIVVTMMPPGSSPGMIAFAIAPANSPRMIQPMMPMQPPGEFFFSSYPEWRGATSATTATSGARGVERLQLVLIGDRVTPQLAVRLDDVGAHPHERRRVGVDRHGRLVAGVQHAMDVARAERERGAGAHRPRDWRARRATEREPLLAHGAGDHGDGPGREVVVVEAGVVVLGPADQPHVEMLVAQQLFVRALRGVVVHVRGPALRLRGELRRDGAQLVARQVATGRPHERGELCAHAAARSRLPASSRCGFTRSSPWPSAVSADGTSGSTTGRSEPCTSCPAPTTAIAARSARGPYDEVSKKISGSTAASAGP